MRHHLHVINNRSMITKHNYLNKKQAEPAVEEANCWRKYLTAGDDPTDKLLVKQAKDRMRKAQKKQKHNSTKGETVLD